MRARLQCSAFRHWQRPCLLLLVLALILPLLVCSYTPAPAPRAYPLLLQMAAERPGELVSVIVQKVGNDNDVEALVRQQGGTITRDLSIIHAFVADIPAGAVPRIAQAAGVQWVSLDASVSQSDTEISTATLLDAYATAIGADGVWSNSHTLQG